jgi:hypothetical protein
MRLSTKKHLVLVIEIQSLLEVVKAGHVTQITCVFEELMPIPECNCSRVQLVHV